MKNFTMFIVGDTSSNGGFLIAMWVVQPVREPYTHIPLLNNHLRTFDAKRLTLFSFQEGHWDNGMLNGTPQGFFPECQAEFH